MVTLSDREPLGWSMSGQYYVYIMTNLRRTVLYTGVTHDLAQRVWQHRNARSGFAAKYHCSQLVMYEVFQDSYNAITREKQIKRDRVGRRWR